MGYRGRTEEQHEARRLRADGLTLAEIAELDAAGIERIGTLSDDAFLVAGTALDAGEGSKADGNVKFVNTDPAMIALFCAWLRRYFDVDERRLRATVYLHEGLDRSAAQQFWSAVTGIPESQFRAPYRPPVRGSHHQTKHVNGCAYVSYACSRTHRAVMGLVRALLSPGAIPG